MVNVVLKTDDAASIDSKLLLVAKDFMLKGPGRPSRFFDQPDSVGLASV